MQRERGNPAFQSAVVRIRLVLVDDAFVGKAVNYGNGSIVGSNGLLLVSGFDGIDYFLDAGANGGALAGIQGASFFSLLGPFLGLRVVGHR